MRARHPLPARRVHGPRAPAGATTLAALLLLATPGGAQTSPGQERACGLCHAELELLRQHVGTLEEARQLFTSQEILDASAHEGMSCGSCHSGFRRFPHEPSSANASCASCHAEAEEEWAGSVHADPDREGLGTAECTACHGVHDIRSADELRSPEGARAANAPCVDCHGTAALPPTDPHADTVACASCHDAHDTRDVDEAASAVAPHRQVTTCGACHEDPATASATDVHGQALAELDSLGAAELGMDVIDPPPTCTSCHGGHGMAGPMEVGFEREMVDRCAACHGDHAERYFGTYHGKATALGSEIAATCDACHGSHGVFAASDPRSAVAPENLVDTCGTCHEHARPAFVEYDSHPDPMDRERNAPLFYSFVFMNSLLVGVLGVFGLHTALWWLRLLIDRRKEADHGTGESHG